MDRRHFFAPGTIDGPHRRRAGRLKRAAQVFLYLLMVVFFAMLAVVAGGLL